MPKISMTYFGDLFENYKPLPNGKGKHIIKIV